MKKICLHILLLVSVITTGLALTSCEDDNTAERWYLSGTWQCMQYPEETLCFFMDGTGHWENNYTGDYEEFNYYCNDDYLWFRWFPTYGPSYTEDCTIYMTNGNAMQITYPGDYSTPPYTLFYSRID